LPARVARRKILAEIHAGQGTLRDKSMLAHPLHCGRVLIWNVPEDPFIFALDEQGFDELTCGGGGRSHHVLSAAVPSYEVPFFSRIVIVIPGLFTISMWVKRRQRRPPFFLNLFEPSPAVGKCRRKKARRVW
jgi:hypothetical protein